MPRSKEWIMVTGKLTIKDGGKKPVYLKITFEPQYSFPDRIQRHVLSNLGLDEDDSFWLMLNISAFLVMLENPIIDANG